MKGNLTCDQGRLRWNQLLTPHVDCTELVPLPRTGAAATRVGSTQEPFPIPKAERHLQVSKQNAK